MQTTNCGLCGGVVNVDSDFCPFCGMLFISDAVCKNHRDAKAEGVCLICEEPYCGECGTMVNDKFFCSEHKDLEIYEGMAKVYGGGDYIQCGYVVEILKQEGIEALIYNRKTSPMHLGGKDYSLFKSAGNSKEHLMNEVKVMVPFSQFIQAKELLNSLDIK